MVAIFVAIVLLVTNSATIQAAGPAAFGWWLLGMLAFLIPGAVVTGQLGVMFLGEGSIYLWTHKAFGDFWGFFAGFCAWWPGVLGCCRSPTTRSPTWDMRFPARWASGRFPCREQ
jgi:amino acid transporter